MSFLEPPPVTDYFLDIAEKSPDGPNWVVLCPASNQLHVYHARWHSLEDVENWIDNHHFNSLTPASGNYCGNEVDFDMHGIVAMEEVVGA